MKYRVCSSRCSQLGVPRTGVLIRCVKWQMVLASKFSSSASWECHLALKFLSSQTAKNTVFWYVTPCCLVVSYRYFYQTALRPRYIQHRRQYTVHFSCHVCSAQLSKSATATKPHRRCNGILYGQQASITKSTIRTSFKFPPLPPSHTAFEFIFNKIKPLQNSSCFCTKTFMTWKL